MAEPLTDRIDAIRDRLDAALAEPLTDESNAALSLGETIGRAAHANEDAIRSLIDVVAELAAAVDALRNRPGA